MEVIKTQNGCLTILSGKTDMGKSTISVLNCSEQIRKGNRIMFFSYEYCQSIIYNKLLVHFGLKWQELFNLNVIDSRGLSLDFMEKVLYNNDVDVVYIDYLDLLRDNTYGKCEDETVQLQQYQTICARLAQVAENKNISIVLLSQEATNATIENTVEHLNSIVSKVSNPASVIEMFIGKDEIFNPLIKCNNMSHVVLVDGYNLQHFSSINLKEAYKND